VVTKVVQRAGLGETALAGGPGTAIEGSVYLSVPMKSSCLVIGNFLFLVEEMVGMTAWNAWWKVALFPGGSAPGA